MKNFDWLIIGAGKLAQALSAWLAGAGQRMIVLARTESRIRSFPREIWSYIDFVSSFDEIEMLPGKILLAIPDSEIENIANEIALRFGKELQGKTVIHFSGISGLEVLTAVSEKQAKPIAAHPYQTFYSYDDDVFEGVPWLVECNEEDRAEAENFVRYFSGIPYFIRTGVNRQLYHASAVVLSNFMNGIFALSRNIAIKSGIDPADFFPKIALTTLENNLKSIEKNEKIPLTGPIIRNDKTTIEKHLDELKFDKFTKDSYIMISKATALLAGKDKLIDENQLLEILKLMKDS